MRKPSSKSKIYSPAAYAIASKLAAICHDLTQENEALRSIIVRLVTELESKNGK